MKKNIIIFFIFLLCVVIILNSFGLNFYHFNNEHENNSNSYKLTDPFILHNEISNSSIKFYIHSGVYGISIASNNLYKNNFYLYINSTNFSYRIYSDYWDYHILSINHSGNYFFNTTDNGRYLLSLNTETPGYSYYFHINEPTTFALATGINGYKKLKVVENANYNMVLYNSILNKIATSNNKSEIYANLSTPNFNGIDFITVMVTSSVGLTLSWGTFSVNFHHTPHFGYIIIAIFIIPISIILLITLYYKKNKKNHHGKFRRR